MKKVFAFLLAFCAINTTAKAAPTFSLERFSDRFPAIGRETPSTSPSLGAPFISPDGNGIVFLQGTIARSKEFYSQTANFRLHHYKRSTGTITSIFSDFPFPRIPQIKSVGWRNDQALVLAEFPTTELRLRRPELSLPDSETSTVLVSLPSSSIETVDLQNSSIGVPSLSAQRISQNGQYLAASFALQDVPTFSVVVRNRITGTDRLAIAPAIGSATYGGAAVVGVSDSGTSLLIFSTLTEAGTTVKALLVFDIAAQTMTRVDSFSGEFSSASGSCYPSDSFAHTPSMQHIAFQYHCDLLSPTQTTERHVGFRDITKNRAIVVNRSIRTGLPTGFAFAPTICPNGSKIFFSGQSPEFARGLRTDLPQGIFEYDVESEKLTSVNLENPPQGNGLPGCLTSHQAASDTGEVVFNCSGFLSKSEQFTLPAANVLTSVLDTLYIAARSDLCPSDSNRINPGVCGCGIPERDSNSDSIVECARITKVTASLKNGTLTCKAFAGAAPLSSLTIEISQVANKKSKLLASRVTNAKGTITYRPNPRAQGVTEYRCTAGGKTGKARK